MTIDACREHDSTALVHLKVPEIRKAIGARGPKLCRSLMTPGNLSKLVMGGGCVFLCDFAGHAKYFLPPGAASPSR
jgi:hypothetical protein